ncbi:MAG: TatD family hydrolase [Clostridia bacterium]|nr:TatD family hydrolase [Clostridia bacterium]
MEPLFGLFDTHAHLNDPRFDEDREEVLKDMDRLGMYNVCVGADMESSRTGIELAERHPRLYAAVGVHPHDAKSYRDPEDAVQLSAWLAQPKVVALGEIGLDYYYDLSPRDVQQTVFRQQLELASELDVPVILHIRDAHGDAIRMMQEMGKRLPHCVVHCSSASWESTKLYLKMGCMISYAGPVTFKKSLHLQEAARQVPDDRLLIETDSPYLAPEPVRGTRNDPRNVAHICRALAGLRETTPEALCARTRENAMAFFRINP